MKTSASRWSKAWLPSVTASAPAADHFVADRLGEAEAAGGVLAVDDDGIEPPALAQGRAALDHGLAAGAPDDVAEEQKAHQRLSGSISSCSVAMASSGTSCCSVGQRLDLLAGEGEAEREDRMKVAQHGMVRS